MKKEIQIKHKLQFSFWSIKNQTCQPRQSFHVKCERDIECLANQLLFCDNRTNKCECIDDGYK